MGMFSLLEMGMFGLLEMGMFSLLEMDMFSLFHFQKFFFKISCIITCNELCNHASNIFIIYVRLSIASMFHVDPDRTFRSVPFTCINKV